MIPLASVSVLHDVYNITNGTITFLGQNDRSDVQHDFLGNICHLHCHQHNVMQTALFMVPLHSLGQDAQNGVQYDFFGHMTPLAPASQNANSIITDTIAFLRSRGLK